MLHADLGYRTKDIIKAWFIRPSSKMTYGEEDQKQTESVSSAIQETLKASPLFQSFSYGESPYELPTDNYGKVSMRIPGGEWLEVLHVRLYKSFFDLYSIKLANSLKYSLAISR